MKHYSAQDFYETISMLRLSFAHDGRSLLVSQDATKIFNACSIDISNGEFTPLTQSSSESIYIVSCFPHDNRFLFSKDYCGNEQFHLFVQALNGDAVEITPGDNLVAEFMQWHENKESFWIKTKVRA